MNSSVWAVWAAQGNKKKNGFKFFWAIFKKKIFFAHKKLKKPPSKVAQKNSNPLFFPYCPELPKRPKQKNSCSKMWLIDQLYIELGWQCSPSSKKGRRKIVSLLLHVTLLHAQWSQNKFSNFRPKPFWSSIMIFTTFYLPMHW